MDKRNEDNILIVPFDITKFDLHKGALDKALSHFEKVGGSCESCDGQWFRPLAISLLKNPL